MTRVPTLAEDAAGFERLYDGLAAEYDLPGASFPVALQGRRNGGHCRRTEPGGQIGLTEGGADLQDPGCPRRVPPRMAADLRLDPLVDRKTTVKTLILDAIGPQANPNPEIVRSIVEAFGKIGLPEDVESATRADFEALAASFQPELILAVSSQIYGELRRRWPRCGRGGKRSSAGG